MPPLVDALTHAVFDGLPILLAGEEMSRGERVERHTGRETRRVKTDAGEMGGKGGRTRKRTTVG